MRTSVDLEFSSLKAVALAVCKRTVPLSLTVLVVVVLLNSPSDSLVIGFSSLRCFDKVVQIDWWCHSQASGSLNIGVL